jgi:hypothetical protein
MGTRRGKRDLPRRPGPDRLALPARRVRRRIGGWGDVLGALSCRGLGPISRGPCSTAIEGFVCRRMVQDRVPPEPVLATAGHVDGVSAKDQRGVPDLKDLSRVGEVGAFTVHHSRNQPRDLAETTRVLLYAARPEHGFGFEELSQRLVIALSASERV